MLSCLAPRFGCGTSRVPSGSRNKDKRQTWSPSAQHSQPIARGCGSTHHLSRPTWPLDLAREMAPSPTRRSVERTRVNHGAPRPGVGRPRQCAHQAQAELQTSWGALSPKRLVWQTDLMLQPLPLTGDGREGPGEHHQPTERRAARPPRCGTASTAHPIWRSDWWTSDLSSGRPCALLTVSYRARPPGRCAAGVTGTADAPGCADTSQLRLGGPLSRCLAPHPRAPPSRSIMKPPPTRLCCPPRSHCCARTHRGWARTRQCQGRPRRQGQREGRHAPLSPVPFSNPKQVVAGTESAPAAVARSEQEVDPRCNTTPTPIQC